MTIYRSFGMSFLALHSVDFSLWTTNINYCNRKRSSKRYQLKWIQSSEFCLTKMLKTWEKFYLKINKTPQCLNALRSEELQAVGFIPTCPLLCLCLSSGTLLMLQKNSRSPKFKYHFAPHNMTNNATWTTSLTSHRRSRIFIPNKLSWRG